MMTILQTLFGLVLCILGAWVCMNKLNEIEDPWVGVPLYIFFGSLCLVGVFFVLGGR
jgi:hypothetical protein